MVYGAGFVEDGAYHAAVLKSVLWEQAVHEDLAVSRRLDELGSVRSSMDNCICPLCFVFHPVHGFSKTITI